MATFSRILLSASTSGRPVKVVATASPGTTIHTAVAGATSFDEIYLWVTNTDTVTRTLTVLWGGTTDPDDYITKTFSISANSAPYPIITGVNLNGGLVVAAFSSAANIMVISGYANRIS
jgi:hypothetical protein